MAILTYTITIVMPIIVLVVYIVKIRSRKPLPDLRDDMTIEEIH
jgi:hypothetical protein